MAKPKKKSANVIAENRRARHDYFLEQRFEAGLALAGWEVKGLREGRGQLTDSYIIFKDNEAFLLGAHIEPGSSTSTHVTPDPSRTRKLLLKRKEIDKLRGAVQAKGYTALATKLYWARGFVKVEIALARGKKQHDKRDTIKQRDWERQKAKTLRDANK